MLLDGIVPDLIVSTDNVSPTPSTAACPFTGPPFTSASMMPSEQDPLVGALRSKRSFFHAHPLWLVPLSLAGSTIRGMTIAPRVELFTELSCRQLHGRHNHTFAPDLWGTLVSNHPQDDSRASFTSIYLPSDSPPISVSRKSQYNWISFGDDPPVDPGRNCALDPAVQAGAAKLIAMMSTTTGALSAITTGWWGHFGERHGRKSVLALYTFGALLAELVFFIVSSPHNPLAAYSDKLLITVAIIDGLLGGWLSGSSATSSYISDCTAPGSRATIFARFSGVMFSGLALGPVVGAWLIRNPVLKIGQANHSLYSLNSVFWVATCAYFLTLLFVLFVLPESLPTSRRVLNTKGKNRTAEEDEAEETNHKDGSTFVIIRLIKGLISPLAVFLPVEVPVSRSAGVSSGSIGHKDWSMTFLALTIFVCELALGVNDVKNLYAKHIYGWAVEQLGFYLSFIAAVRAFHLLILLPFLLVTFGPVQTALSSPISMRPKPTNSQLFSDIRFDVIVTRCSMCAQFCSFALVSLTSLCLSAWWSQLMFVAATSLGCGGSGIMPTIDSLALSILQYRKLVGNDETARLQSGSERNVVERDSTPGSGQLFGALAVLRAVSQSMLAPVTFAMIYSSTVASFPQAIFVSGAALVMVAIVLTLFIRLDLYMGGDSAAKSCVPSKCKADVTKGTSRERGNPQDGLESSYGATRNDPSVSGSSEQV